MRNTTINNQLKRQETALLDQAKNNQRRTLVSRLILNISHSNFFEGTLY